MSTKQPPTSSRKADRGRWSSRRKAEIVLRLLRGEDLDAVSREVGVTAAKLAEWRDASLAGMQAALQSRQTDGHDFEVRDLKTKLGDQLMTIELLEQKIEHLEDGLRPPSRRRKP